MSFFVLCNQLIKKIKKYIFMSKNSHVCLLRNEDMHSRD